MGKAADDRIKHIHAGPGKYCKYMNEFDVVLYKLMIYGNWYIDVELSCWTLQLTSENLYAKDRDDG